jgi:hypothetical protein
VTEIAVDAFLADSVSSEDGKLHAQGAGWNRILTPVLPTLHGRIGLGLVVRIPSAAAGAEHEIEVVLRGPDGEVVPLGLMAGDGDAPIESVTGTFSVDGDGAVEEELLPVAINVDGLRLERAGVHRFVVRIDGATGRSVPFAVAVPVGEGGDAAP